MENFHEWLESRQMDDYVNQTLSMQLNKMKMKPRNTSLMKKYGFTIVDPASQMGVSMNLPGDYIVIAGDGGFALLNFDNGRWMPLPAKYMPQGSPSQASLLGRAEKVPQMAQPTKYNFGDPTAPRHSVGSGNPPDDARQYSWYDPPKFKN